jgi:ribonuclease HI
MYAIKCMTLWGPAWKKKGWKRDSGEPLQNLDLIQPLVALWADRPKSWTIKHVYGHQKGPSAEAYGNNWVDQAAVAAAAGAPVLGPAQAPAPTQAVILKKKVSGPYVQSDLRKWFGDGAS